MSQSYLRLKMFIKINKIILHVSKSFKTITTKLYINTCIKYIVIFMKMLYESKLLRIQMLIKINQPITLKNFFKSMQSYKCSSCGCWTSIFEQFQRYRAQYFGNILLEANLHHGLGWPVCQIPPSLGPSA